MVHGQLPASEWECEYDGDEVICRDEDGETKRIVGDSSDAPDYQDESCEAMAEWYMELSEDLNSVDPDEIDDPHEEEAVIAMRMMQHGIGYRMRTSCLDDL